MLESQGNTRKVVSNPLDIKAFNLCSHWSNKYIMIVFTWIQGARRKLCEATKTLGQHSRSRWQASCACTARINSPMIKTTQTNLAGQNTAFENKRFFFPEWLPTPSPLPPRHECGGLAAERGGRRGAVAPGTANFRHRKFAQPTWCKARRTEALYKVEKCETAKSRIDKR
jgi:hypothetical protein